MKLMHLSDLHLGKHVNGFSLLPDQKYILEQIIDIAKNEKIAVIMIAGDIYDKAVPVVEAVNLLDDFLYRLSELKIKVFIINGNHDNAERISFGGRLMRGSEVYFAPAYNGEVGSIAVSEAVIYMLPFIRPSDVRSAYPDEIIKSFNDAVRVALSKCKLDNEKINILITHQFITGGVSCDSEELSVGGTDNVDAKNFDGFDYVALGHLHGPQYIGRESCRYSGSPLKYSFSEATHKKSVVVLEINPDDIDIKTIPLSPLRDMREITGTYMELTSRAYYEKIKTDDYLRITLTDEEDILDGMAKLRVIYPYLMKLDYNNKRTRSSFEIDNTSISESKGPVELFAELYEKQNNAPMSEQQREYLERLVMGIGEVL